MGGKKIYNFSLQNYPSQGLCTRTSENILIPQLVKDMGPDALFNKMARRHISFGMSATSLTQLLYKMDRPW
jgi:hypothetical protein